MCTLLTQLQTDDQIVNPQIHAENRRQHAKNIPKQIVLNENLNSLFLRMLAENFPLDLHLLFELIQHVCRS